MSDTDESIPEDVSVESLPIHNPQAAVPDIRFLSLNELDAYDVSPPSTPPPAYSPPPPPYSLPSVICFCSEYERPWILTILRFNPEVSHEIWNRWQLLKAQNPDIYQNMQPCMLFYCFLSFAFQVTRLPFAPPWYDPRRFSQSMVVYLNSWGISSLGYVTRQWDEAQRIAECSYAAAMWMVRSLNVGCERCLGQPPPIYVGNVLDEYRIRNLMMMATAATSVL